MAGHTRQSPQIGSAANRLTGSIRLFARALARELDESPHTHDSLVQPGRPFRGTCAAAVVAVCLNAGLICPVAGRFFEHR